MGPTLSRSSRLAAFDSGALDRRSTRLITHVVLPLFEWLNAHYFRLILDGKEHLPRGPALYVGNHNGGILGPDLFCTLATLWRHLADGSGAPLYMLAHDFAMQQFTPLGRILQALGALRANRENALRALANGASVLVYPGGDLEAYRHFSRRHEVVIAPRTGFIDVARAAGVPVVPIVAHGAHRSALIFDEGEWIARLLRLQNWGRLQRFPLALALPWIVAPGPWLPYLPLPFRVRLRVLPSVDIASGSSREAAERVQVAMQAALTALAT